MRRRIVEWEPPDQATADMMAKAYANAYLLGHPARLRAGPERSLAAVAAAAGRSPLEVAYDAMPRTRGRAALHPHPQLLLG